MKQLIRNGAITVLICIVLLFATALIPRSAIQHNMEKSAEYFNSHISFDHVTENAFISRQDNYADCILANIIYHIDSKNLLESVVGASYYNPDEEPQGESLSYATSHETEPNVDYSRYWHGSMVLLRPLFVVFDVVGVRMALGITVLVFSAIFVFLLIWKRYYTFAICYIFGLFATSVWMTLFCIEYAMTLLVMSVELVIFFAVLLRHKLDDIESKMYRLLLSAGIITAFVDFLTTETVTFTVPFLIYIIYKERNDSLGSFKEEFPIFIRAGISWLVGYASMMLLKWLLALTVLGPDAFFNALKQAALRMNGDATVGNVQGASNVSVYERISGALWRNIGNLLPFKDTMRYLTVKIFIALIIVITFSVWYMFRIKAKNGMLLMLLLLMSLPLLRFLVINNHSYIHFFFTYRAMLVTVTAWAYAMIWLIAGYIGKNRKNAGRRRT